MFDWSLVLGNPFWLGSIPFAFIGWLIAFIGQCIGDRSQISWWYIFYHLFLLIGVLMVIVTDSLRQYRLVITAFIVLAIAYATAEISFALAASSIAAAYAAIAAGYIFMTFVMFTWVFAFGASEDSFIFVQLNSYSVAAKPDQNNVLPMANNGVNGSHYSSQQGGIPMGTVGGGYLPSSQSGPISNYNAPDQVNAAGATASISPNAEYTYKAKALYAYDANPEDANEISFVKGEILDIVDNKGKWWQARKDDGTVGIAPSNYLEIQ